MHKVLTVGELVEALNKYPPHVPVFGYSVMDEGDFAVQEVELSGPLLEPDDQGVIQQLVPHGCQGDSIVDRYWKQHGYCPVVYIRNYY